MTAGQVLILAVTGSDINDYGAFKLSIAFEQEGASLSTAAYIGTKAAMSVTGTTKGYPSTYASQCNAGKPDGPDRVSRRGLRPCCTPQCIAPVVQVRSVQ